MKTKPPPDPEDEELFEIKDLPDMLKMSMPAIRYHIYVSKDLVPSLQFQKKPIFKRKDLDAFKKRRRPQGRPFAQRDD